MAPARKLNALFYPQIVCLDESVLKYLLLIYDTISYLPNDTHLNPGHTRISARFSMYDGLLFGAFGTRKDAQYGLMYASEPSGWDDEMKRLMDAYDLLEDRGVCVALEEETFASPYHPHPLQAAVDSDVGDGQFVYWCDRYRNPRIFVPDQPKAAQIKGGGLMIRPPTYQGAPFFSALCSERINSCLYFAGLRDLVPVSNHDLFIRLFGIKLKRTLDSPACDVDPRERHRNARFSSLSWELLTEVVPPQALAKRTVSEILDYKAEAAEHSARFREYLFRLEAGLSSEPWDEKLKEEIEKLVRTGVLPELQKVREEKARIWEKLFHESLKSVFAEAHLKAIVPLLTMHLLPAVSYLDLICYSTAFMAGGVFPKLLEAREQEKELRRNALFFVFNLAPRG
jgi:hypothetical protein